MEMVINIKSLNIVDGNMSLILIINWNYMINSCLIMGWLGVALETIFKFKACMATDNNLPYATLHG